MSKRGDSYLRTLLIHGARLVIYRAGRTLQGARESDWPGRCAPSRSPGEPGATRAPPSVVEVLRIPNGGDQSACRDWADTWYLREPRAEFAVSVPCLDLRLNFFDLPVELLEMVKQSLDKLAERARQWVVGVFDQFRNPRGDATNALGNDKAKVQSHAVGSTLRAYQLHVELEWVYPRVWRRLLVPPTIDLSRLHVALL